jgi:hypothetical protein
MQTHIISSESSESSHRPSIAIDNLGNLHVVWSDYTDYNEAGTDTDIFYKLWNITSQSWGSTIVVSTESTMTSSFPSITIDSQNNAHIVWHDLTDYGGAGAFTDIFYKLWNATSLVWGDTEVVSTETTYGGTNPSIVIDSKNNIHVVWDDESQINYKRWNATSLTWGSTVIISTESPMPSNTASIIIDSLDNVHVTWQDGSDYDGAGEQDYDIFYKQWNVSSSIWETTYVVSTESTTYAQHPCIAIDDQNNIHIVWDDGTDYKDGSGSDYDIYYTQWNTTSLSWDSATIVSSVSASDSTYPEVIIDSLNNIHIVWEDTSEVYDSGNDTDIFYSTPSQPDVITETETETETEIDTQTTTKTDTETQTSSITVPGTDTQTDFVTSTVLIEETTTITNAKSEVSLGIISILSSLVILPLIFKKFRNN